MKKIIAVSILFVSSISFAQTSELPKIFTSEQSISQDRICGDLLVGMSIAVARSGSKSKEDFINDVAYHSVLFLNLSQSLPKDGKEKARKISREIESLSFDTHLETLKYCKDRVSLLLSSGKFTGDEQRHAHYVSKEILAKLSSLKK